MKIGFGIGAAPVFFTGKEKEMYEKGWRHIQDIQTEDLYPYADIEICLEGGLSSIMYSYTFWRSQEYLDLLFKEDHDNELEWLKTEKEENIRLFLNGVADNYLVQAFNIFTGSIESFKEEEEEEDYKEYLETYQLKKEDIREIF